MKGGFNNPPNPIISICQSFVDHGFNEGGVQ